MLPSLVVFTLIFLSMDGARLDAQTITEEKYSRSVTEDIAYGREKGNIGVHYDKHNYRESAQSFSHDSEGNLYICDTVNRSVQIFSAKGKYIRTISLRDDREANDIALDRSGRIYVYDEPRSMLCQYDKKGDLLSSLSIDSRPWRSRGPMHIINNEIFMRTGGQEDVLIGRITAAGLLSPTADDTSKRAEKGIHGLSGRRYFTRIQRMRSGELEVLDKDGDRIKLIKLLLNGIVSITYLQEDGKGNVYLQTERLENGKILLEVQKYDSEGNHVTTVLIPDNDYGSWSVKLVSLDEEGNLYQFLPKEDKGQINIFQKD